MTEDEYRDGLVKLGQATLLWDALIEVIESHPDPASATQTALRAAEAAIARRLHRPSTPDAMMDAMIDLQARLPAALAQRRTS